MTDRGSRAEALVLVTNKGGTFAQWYTIMLSTSDAIVPDGSRGLFGWRHTSIPHVRRFRCLV